MMTYSRVKNEDDDSDIASGDSEGCADARVAAHTKFVDKSYVVRESTP